MTGNQHDTTVHCHLCGRDIPVLGIKDHYSEHHPGEIMPVSFVRNRIDWLMVALCGVMIGTAATLIIGVYTILRWILP